MDQNKQQVPTELNVQQDVNETLAADRSAQTATDPKPSKKKPILIFIAIIVLIAAAVGAYFLFFKDTPAKSVPQNSQTNSQQTSKTKFYLSSSPSSVKIYDSQTNKVTTQEHSKQDSYNANDISGNFGLQFSKDGSKVARAVVKHKVEPPTEGPQATEYTKIIVSADNKDDEVLMLMSPATLLDWILSPDGMTIYYIKVTPKGQNNSPSDSSDLRKIDIATKKDTLAKENVVDATAIKLPLTVNSKGDLLFYTSLAYKITQHKYDGRVYVEKDLGTKHCKDEPSLSFPQPASPDGKSLLLGCLVDSKFAYYILDIASSKASESYVLDKSTEALRAGYWSPDSKQVAFDVSAYGREGQEEIGFKNRFEILDVATKKAKLGFSDPAPSINAEDYASHFVSLLGWSPDGKYIAFENANKVKIYTVAMGEIQDSGIVLESPVDSNTFFGWFGQ